MLTRARFARAAEGAYAMAMTARLMLVAAVFTAGASAPFPGPAAAQAPDTPLKGFHIVYRCQAEAPGKIDHETAETLAELIGAPVFAAGGAEIGQVADIAFDDQGRPARLRITTQGTLGLGERTVNIPNGAYMVLRGAVVLDLTPDQLRRLPDTGGQKP